MFLEVFECIVILHLCVLECMCHMSAGAYGGQKGPLDPLELELQVSVSLSMCVLGTEPRPSIRVVSALLKHPSSPVVLNRMV